MTAHTPILTPLAVQNADVLFALRHGVYATPTELAHRLGRDKSNMRRTLDSLESAGLVAFTGDKPGTFPSLTDAGRAAQEAVERAENPTPPPPRVNAGDMLMLRHDQMRPNPRQPREVDETDPVQSQEIDQLAATIAAAGDVLQNLVVFPADEDGVHAISAGERRWRAVGRLIELAVWPADKPLRALVTEAVAAQDAFIALIENGQRKNLHPVEEMKAYAELTDMRGWSARQAALETGRDVRTVQEMLRVWREAAPDDIAACKRGELTWEQLRNSVKVAKPAEPEAPPPAPTPAPAAPAPIIGGAGAGASMPPKPIPAAAAPDHELTPDQRRTMAELDWALSQRPTGYATDGAPYVACGKYWLDQTAAELKALRLVVFLHTGGIFAAMTNAGHAWCEANLVPGEVEGEAIETPWLKPETEDAQDRHVAADRGAPPVAEEEAERPPADALAKAAQAERDDEYAQATRALSEAVRAITRDDDQLLLPAFEAAGIAFPLRLDQGGEVIDANEEPVFELCGHGDLVDDLIRARAMLLVTALNLWAEMANMPLRPEQPARKTESDPAVPVRRSITPHHITCLEDGRQMASISLHLRSAYGLTREGYLARWGLPADYPLVAPYESQNRFHALRDFLGCNPDSLLITEDEEEA